MLIEFVYAISYHISMESFHSKTNTFSRNLTAFFDARLEQFGLATSYVELMILLKRSDDFSQKELAQYLSLAPSTITRFIDKLEKQGYVKKVRKGREAYTGLTENGRKVSEEMESVYKSAVEDLKEIVGEKFVITVGKLLDFGNGVLKEAKED
ncbi:hypothetical protein BH23BAC3_BH23BAC3_22800 [soil metagenome]